MKLDIDKLVNVKRQSDGSIQCQCPICAAEGKDKSSKNHLRIYKTGAFNCIIDNSKQHNYAISRYLKSTNSDENPDYEYIDPEPILKIEKVYPEDTLKRLLPDYTYWINRGAREDVLRKLEGGLAPEDEKSKLSKRFIFPIRNMDNRIVGFTGRLIQENSFAPNWKHIFKSSKSVWPWHVNGKDIASTKTVVLVESVGDTLALMSNDVPNVLCLFGLNLNGKIISSLIAADVKKIIISLNNDVNPDKGQRAAEKIRNKLCAFFQEDHLIIRLPTSGKDWGEATKEEIQQFKQEITT